MNRRIFLLGFAALPFAPLAGRIGRDDAALPGAGVGVAIQPDEYPYNEDQQRRPFFSTVEEYCANAEEIKFMGLINEYRADNGVGELKLSQTLGAAAEHHALDMAATGNNTHTLSDGTTWLQNIINHEYPFDYRSENIAWGYSSAESVLAAWKASPGHNTNMLRPGFGAMGISRRLSPGGYPNWVNTFACCLDQLGEFCVATIPTATATNEPKPGGKKTATPTSTLIPTSTRTPTSTPVSTSTVSVPTPTPTSPQCGPAGCG